MSLHVHGGVMDLGTWNSDRDKIIRLDGEWEFYWDKLLTPDDFRKQAIPSVPSDLTYVKVPSTWNGNNVDGMKLPEYGAATYRMVLKNVPYSGIFALKKTNIRFSSRIYVNGQELLEDGLPARNAQAYESGNRPQTGIFSVDGGQIEIIVQVANYDYINAGITVSLLFGKEADLLDRQQKELAHEFVMLALLGTLALIYFICFIVAAIYRKKDYSLLLLALMCLLYGLYNGLMGERPLFLVVHGISFEALYKFKDVLSIISCMVLAIFFYYQQKSIISLKLTQSVSLILGVFALMIPFLSISQYTVIQYYIVIFYSLLQLWLLVKAAYLFVRSEQANRLKSLLLCMAVLTVNLYSIDAILFSISVIDNLWGGQYCVILLNIIMIFLVVLRFFEAYHTIDEMKNELLRLDKIKDEFLSNTSHELRTPLNAMVNISESLLRGVGGLVNDAQAQNLTVIMNSGRRLTHLVNELLDYSKLKHGDIKLHHSELILNTYVESVIQLHQFLLTGTNTKLVNRVPEYLPLVYADGNRLIQILHNLIGNAIKFCDQGVVEVSAAVAGDWVEVSVSDTGIGIDVDMQERIFWDYEQGGHVGTTHQGGTGLGLGITKRLVELHGGEIRVSSNPGQGAIFIFTLPIFPEKQKKPSETTMRTIEKPFPPNFGMSHWAYPLTIEGEKQEPILVVDDDSANLQSMMNLFKLEGHTIIVANRGELALQLLSRHDLFLVVLDITIPDLSGFEVLKRIRERYSPFELPVLMLTARNRSGDIRLAMELGANDFVDKPFESEELMARVRSLLRLKSSVKLARDAEIAFLRSQIKPHFLYNALTAIAELCVTDSVRAEEVTLQLSRYLRNSFDFKQLDALTTLANELELVKSYVAIEQARFGNRLQVEYEVDADPDLLIPPLMIQPLVENAIRHGVRAHSKVGRVTISVKEPGDGKVVLHIEDDGRGMSDQKLFAVLNPDTAAKGIGLWNISQRLRLLYGTDLRIESKEGQGTRIEIVLPATTFLRKGV
ncbi:ATP-binding protein [Paenibacillus thalictri]|uniref:ATP-binding protein n=1 Tax=Paenibacillus thalictri TaxID=2527873 RepID=UPI0013EF0EC7|nr:ATP-binding protein [Paenibacillus thalictri]